MIYLPLVALWVVFALLIIPRLFRYTDEDEE
jgi:membrane protein YdbS with pleckstrin-like domain